MDTVAGSWSIPFANARPSNRDLSRVVVYGWLPSQMPSALYTIAHAILPNIMKLKTAAVVVSAIERNDASIFSHVWTQTGVAHTPQMLAKERNDTWRIAVMSLPPPQEMGEAHMVAFVAKKNDAGVMRYFALEHDFVLATQTTRTALRELDRGKPVHRGDGPPITGDFQTDASALIEGIMRILSPVG